MSYSASSFGIPTKALSVTKQSTNNSGTTIPFFVPVKLTSTGMATINPSLEADVLSIAGVTTASVLNGDTGNIINSGTVLAVPVAFNPGDPVYVSKSGGVTNVKPDDGVGGFVAGDWVVRLGFIVENESIPGQLDCLVNIAIVAQIP